MLLPINWNMLTQWTALCRMSGGAGFVIATPAARGGRNSTSQLGFAMSQAQTRKLQFVCKLSRDTLRLHCRDRRPGNHGGRGCKWRNYATVAHMSGEIVRFATLSYDKFPRDTMCPAS